MYKYERLARLLTDQITSNKFQVGQRLPSIRQLSEEHGIAKISVQTALQKLESMGLVSARPKSGYFVCKQKPKTPSPRNDQKILAPAPVSVPQLFHQIMARSAAFDIKPDSEFVTPSNAIEILNRSISRAMRHQSFNNAMYYSEPQGDEGLRRQLQSLYQANHLTLDLDDICITAGCQNSLFLALSVACNPGDSVIVESPAFYGVLQLLEHLNLNVIEVSVSSTQGMTAEQLNMATEKWGAKVCVLTPNFATPTGACIPRKEKIRIAELATTKGLTIIEDDIYGDLGFSFRPEPLKSFDKSGQIILCSSFSKSLSRDVRIGWVSGGKLHDKIVQLKLINQLAGSRSVQQGVASFLEQGHYRRHLQQYRVRLSKQRDQLLSLIDQYFKGACRYTVPDGGLSLWVELSSDKDTIELYGRANKQNITITPGPLFSSANRFHPFLRLSFVHPYEGKRAQALQHLGKLIN